MTQKQTPSLRFPEFRGAWEMKRLGEALTSISNGLNLEQVKEVTSYKVTRIETISNDVINTEKVGYIKPEQDISSYKLNIGDMLYSNINSLSHIGRVVIIDRDYNLYHGMNLLRLVVDKNLNNPQFIYYLLNTEEMKLSFKSRANPAVNQASINQTELSKTRIIVPPLAEQKKIAACLSSLDEVITAQGDKLDGLKDYKRGLMQRLFPAKGQTTPAFRFPEFQGKDPWQEKQLSKVANVIAGQSPEGSAYNKEGIGVPFYQGKTNFGDIYLKKPTTWTTQTTKLAQEGNILMSVRAPVGALNISTGKICIGRGVASIQAKQNKWYLYYFLKKNEKYIVGNGGSIFDSINKSQIEAIKILIPPTIEEQHRIADCLSALDGTITAQKQTIKDLKNYKNGLMQQLFPKIEELKQ